MSMITQQGHDLRAMISALERKYGREPGSVQLIGISKKHPASAIREAWDGGVRQIGESYVQEALPKIAALADLPVIWHFVGRIQSNKTAAIAASFDWVHSIDRLRVAQRLSEQRPDHLPALNCCLEVRLSAEQSKGGVAHKELAQLAHAVAALPRLRLRGLMVLPPATVEPERQREPFALLAQYLEELRASTSGLDTLSMGMSADMEAAIAEGATMVRIGTALFGARAAH